MTQTYADLWLAAVTQKGREGRREERKGKEREREGVKGEGAETEGSGGYQRWDVVSPLTQGSRDEQLAMNT